MTDSFDSYASSLTAPLANAIAVAPNDAADLAHTSRALHIGGAGDLTVTLKGGGTPVTFSGMAAGWHPLRVVRVWATGTTATSIVAGW